MTISGYTTYNKEATAISFYTKNQYNKRYYLIIGRPHNLGLIIRTSYITQKAISIMDRPEGDVAIRTIAKNS